MPLKLHRSKAPLKVFISFKNRLINFKRKLKKFHIKKLKSQSINQKLKSKQPKQMSRCQL